MTLIKNRFIHSSFHYWVQAHAFTKNKVLVSFPIYGDLYEQVRRSLTSVVFPIGIIEWQIEEEINNI
jgi:hypothetical protein